MIIYNKVVAPFESPILNKLEIFNEVCVILAVYHLFCFTPFVSDASTQYNVGWSMIGVTAFNVVGNIAVMLYCSFKNLKVLYQKLK